MCFHTQIKSQLSSNKETGNFVYSHRCQYSKHIDTARGGRDAFSGFGLKWLNSLLGGITTCVTAESAASEVGCLNFLLCYMIKGPNAWSEGGGVHGLKLGPFDTTACSDFIQ